MVDRTVTLIAGALLVAATVLALLLSLLAGVELPALAYAPIAAGLFAGVFLIGRSYPEQPI